VIEIYSYYKYTFNQIVVVDFFKNVTEGKIFFFAKLRQYKNNKGV
jgi:hypothetical protein